MKKMDTDRIKAQLRSWWRKIRKKDCPTCQTELKWEGYCDPCNSFPHRKWIDLAEADFLQEEDWRRRDPEGYAEVEYEYRKSCCKGTIQRWTLNAEQRPSLHHIPAIYPLVYEDAYFELAMLDEFRDEYNML